MSKSKPYFKVEQVNKTYGDYFNVFDFPVFRIVNVKSGIKKKYVFKTYEEAEKFIESVSFDFIRILLDSLQDR